MDGDYAALVPCATGEGWIGGERFNGGLGGGGFHGYSIYAAMEAEPELILVPSRRRTSSKAPVWSAL